MKEIDQLNQHNCFLIEHKSDATNKKRLVWRHTILQRVAIISALKRTFSYDGKIGEKQRIKLAEKLESNEEELNEWNKVDRHI
ncbi:CLUMA_CG010120, isoform A [Clunio marinus]|uniref:CLUMA_CG010120, isoform A n=1 Tax=Clunio marinus TaxID=568069 RepID=A0A1J1IAJ8_9DIPT|nr:CLUMA_CG010120, isoform A [Clunio marinus]